MDVTHLYDLFFRKEIIDLAACVVVCRLRAVLAVLWTSSTPSVDDGTEINLISHTCLADPVCALAEFLQIACQKFKSSSLVILLPSIISCASVSASIVFSLFF